MATIFGEIAGDAVHEMRIGAGGIAASVLTYGAILRDLTIETARGKIPVVPGYASLAGYRPRSTVGAIVGRYANRIGGARFTLDGATHHLPANEGPNHLHGGPEGFQTRIWRLVESAADRVVLEYVSADGEMGYPGRLTARAIYETPSPLVLRMTTEATTDRPTPANIISHAYYNLDGEGDVRDHRLTIHAQKVVEVDAAAIPTGAILPVEGTPHDFRRPRTLRSGGIGYNINYVLDGGGGALARAAVLEGPRSGLAMELWTNEPGLQLYDGMNLTAPLGPYRGLCLEAQKFPDSPNHPNFPDAILRPGDLLRQIVELRFSGA